MAILDSIKDPETGQIKKPILYSLIGGAALLAYLVLKGKGTSGVSSTGQTTPLTPDLTALQSALQGFKYGGGGGGASSSPSLDPPTPTATTTPTSYIAGSSGAAGGGGGGTGAVIQPIAKTPTVYSGLTTATPLHAPAGAVKSPITPIHAPAGAVKSPITPIHAPAGAVKSPIKQTSSVFSAKVMQTSTAKAPPIHAPAGAVKSPIAPVPIVTPLVRNKAVAS